MLDVKAPGIDAYHLYVYLPLPQSEDRFLLNGVVKPCLSNFLSREICHDAMLCQCTDEDECAGHVVIRDHQGGVESIMDVAANVAQFLQNSLMGPYLKGSTKIDPDELH